MTNYIWVDIINYFILLRYLNHITIEMKMAYLNFPMGFILLSFLFVLGLGNVDAKISNQQIQIIRSLNVQEQFKEDFIQHYDEVRDWILDITLSKPKAGRASVTCLACRVVINIFIEYVRANEDISEMIDLLKTVACEAADFINVLHPDVCRGALDMYAADLHYIFRHNLEIQAGDVCTMFLGKGGNCDGPFTEKYYNWTINLPTRTPPPNTDPLWPSDTPTLKVLQLTDIHLDLDYEVGKNTECGKPMCCQRWEEEGVDDDSAAGNHGDYHCDMPQSAMNELFEYSASMEGYDYEFVMMTGDIPPHNIWNTTISGNLEHYKATNDKILSVFPNTPVYPVLGNHEPHPCNLYPPPEVWSDSRFDKAWMYNNITDAYTSQLKDEDAINSFRANGYYTVKHKDTNLRIIVINTNFGYTFNFWLFYQPIDPQGQLQWLADTLSAAELAGERVYILGHMPTGSGDCFTVWSANFEKIIVHFSGIIMGQFYGHTHNDQLEIFYDSSAQPPKPVNSLYVGASTTAHQNLNPGFKVYHVDGSRGAESSWEILDHETFVYNLTEANENVAPNGPMPWYSLYKAKEAFGLQSLRAGDLDFLAYRMLFDGSLFDKYHRFYHKASDVASKCQDITCKLDYICDMVIANSGDYSHCDRFKEYLFIGPSTGGGQPTTTPATTVSESTGTPHSSTTPPATTISESTRTPLSSTTQSGGESVHFNKLILISTYFIMSILASLVF